MAKQRASIFDSSEELDVSGFRPKSKTEASAPPAEQVREVSLAAQFRSREATAPKAEAPAKRPARRYRTGRNVQINVKAQQKTVDAIYALCEEQGWVLGYALQRAVEALQRELKKPS